MLDENNHLFTNFKAYNKRTARNPGGPVEGQSPSVEIRQDKVSGEPISQPTKGAAENIGERLYKSWPLSQ